MRLKTMTIFFMMFGFWLSVPSAVADEPKSPAATSSTSCPNVHAEVDGDGHPINAPCYADVPKANPSVTAGQVLEPWSSEPHDVVPFATYSGQLGSLTAAPSSKSSDSGGGANNGIDSTPSDSDTDDQDKRK
jgi:hypothetical protein